MPSEGPKLPTWGTLFLRRLMTLPKGCAAAGIYEEDCGGDTVTSMPR
jgi:hypothetical protein